MSAPIRLLRVERLSLRLALLSRGEAYALHHPAGQVQHDPVRRFLAAQHEGLA